MITQQNIYNKTFKGKFTRRGSTNNVDFNDISKDLYLKLVVKTSHKREQQKEIIHQLECKNEEMIMKRKNNTQKIQYFEQEIELHQAKISLIKTVLKNYYLNVLKKGDMVRKNGIVWVIHKLWKLKIGVNDSMLPDFLDKETKNFLYNYAHMSGHFKTIEEGEKETH